MQKTAKIDSPHGKEVTFFSSFQVFSCVLDFQALELDTNNRTLRLSLKAISLKY